MVLWCYVVRNVVCLIKLQREWTDERSVSGAWIKDRQHFIPNIVWQLKIILHFSHRKLVFVWQLNIWTLKDISCTSRIMPTARWKSINDNQSTIMTLKDSLWDCFMISRQKRKHLKIYSFNFPFYLFLLLTELTCMWLRWFYFEYACDICLSSFYHWHVIQ